MPRKDGIRIGVMSDINTISNTIRNMSADELDEVMVDCGIERIKPSKESDYIQAVKKNLRGGKS